jgi:Flp pilus assembly protein TadG
MKGNSRVAGGPWSGSRGQSLVEFALVLPVMLLLFMAVFDFGRYIFADNEINNAAREGMRTAIVNQYAPDIRQRTAAQAFALGVPASAPTACDPNNVPADANGICVKFVDQGTLANNCGPITVGCVAVLTVKYTYEALTPVIGRVIGPRVVVSTSKQPIESVCTASSGCPTR